MSLGIAERAQAEMAKRNPELALLAELVAAPRAFALPVFHPCSTMVLGLALWLDKDAPQSVADKTVAGTLDFQTIN